MNRIRVLVADDHTVVRLGLVSLLRYQKGITVVGEAEDGESAVRLARELEADVVVMDLMMPGIGGVEATRRIAARRPATKVVILTTFGSSAEAAAAVAAGAAGAVVKGDDTGELIRAIRCAASGDEPVISDEIRQSMRRRESLPTLTDRQREILKSVTRGLSNPDIACQLDISPDAVKQHLNAIFQKLGAATRAEAVAIAMRDQLLKI